MKQCPNSYLSFKSSFQVRIAPPSSIVYNLHMLCAKEIIIFIMFQEIIISVHPYQNRSQSLYYELLSLLLISILQMLQMHLSMHISLSGRINSIIQKRRELLSNSVVTPSNCSMTSDPKIKTGQNSVQVSTPETDEERKDVYKQSIQHFDDMRIAAYALDIIRGVIVGIGNFFTKRNTKKREDLELAAFIVTGLLLLGVVVALLIKQFCKDYDKQNKCKGSTCCYSCANLLMGLAVMSYFAGDNLTVLYDTTINTENLRIASQILLITGIAGFRLLPQLKDSTYKCFDDEDENALDECIEENDEDEDKKSMKEINIVQAYFKKNVALLPEIDAWYTAILNIFSTCSGAVIGATWTAYVMALIIITVFLIVKICGDIQLLEKCYNIAIIIIFGIMMLAAAGLYLVSDNEMLLDCTLKCASSKVKCNAKKGLRIACTVVSSIPIIGMAYTSQEKIKRKWKEAKNYLAKKCGCCCCC